MHHPQRWFSLTIALLLLVGLTITGIGGARAQDDSTPLAGSTPRPAHIHTGGCDELGEVVAPLTDLSSPAGDSVGQAESGIDLQPQYSFTNVPLALTDIVAADHAINVHLSVDQIDTYIACGNIGGVIDTNGSLVIGLRELEDSGYTGVAVLTASTIDPATTDISVFIVQSLSSGAGLLQDDSTADVGLDGTPTVELPVETGTPSAGSDVEQGTDDDTDGGAGEDVLEDGTPEMNS